MTSTELSTERADLLATLQRERADARPVHDDDPEGRFAAEQNAAVALDAERYYRAMVGGDGLSWNVRDVHMADTLDRCSSTPAAGPSSGSTTPTSATPGPPTWPRPA